MFREIRSSERNLNLREAEKEDGYRKIKPVSDITTEQANKFWRDMFESMRKES